MKENLTDIELIKLANTGDEDSMTTLYYRYRDWVYGLAFRFCGNKEDAQEVLQEVFLYFFNKFPGFELRSALKTFLYPAVKNTSISIIRKKRKVISIDDSAALNIPDEAVDRAAEYSDLSHYLEGMTKDEKELVLLRFYDELKLNEIAEVIDVPLGTVKSRLNRLLARLKEKIKKI